AGGGEEGGGWAAPAVTARRPPEGDERLAAERRAGVAAAARFYAYDALVDEPHGPAVSRIRGRRQRWRSLWRSRRCRGSGGLLELGRVTGVSEPRGQWGASAGPRGETRGSPAAGGGGGT